MKGEKILIDTSVWIDYFNGRDSSAAQQTDNILDTAEVYVPMVVIAELIQGAKTQKEIAVIKEFLDAFHIIDHSKSTWIEAGELSFSMKQKGRTINLTDCYISIIARENACKIFTMDKHFTEIKKFIDIEVL